MPCRLSLGLMKYLDEGEGSVVGPVVSSVGSWVVDGDSTMGKHEDGLLAEPRRSEVLIPSSALSSSSSSPRTNVSSSRTAPSTFTKF